MLRSRFFWQWCGALAVTILVSTLVFAFIASSQLQTAARNNVHESLGIQASMLRPLLLPYMIRNKLMTSAQLSAIAGGESNRVTVLDASGRVLADNRSEARSMDDQTRRPEVLKAEIEGTGVAERYSSTLSQEMLFFALRVDRKPGQVAGYIVVSVPLDSVDRQLSTLRDRIFASGAVIAAFFLVLGYFIARQIAAPIYRMIEGAASIAHGDYDLRLPENRRDEIGRLAIALNALARGTEERIDALVSNRNQLAAVLSGLTEGVIAVDLGQKIVHINDSARHMLRLRNRDLIDAPLWEVVRVSEIVQAVETCLSELTTVNATVKVGAQTLDVAIVLLRDESWTAAEGAIIVLQDITEMLRLEQVRSDFVANASHELKTPISAIRGLVETIMDDPEMTEEVRNRFVERIKNQATRLDHIVQDLIHLSRFDTQARKLSVMRIDLGFLLRQIYKAQVEAAEAAGLTLRIEMPEDTIEVEGEREALEQMVINLVDNALKYSKAEGEVVLRLSTLGQMAVIEVRDDGIGIPEDEQQRIFERFYRVDRARSREKGGTGLGLSIVKHIAQSHNGSVTVDSQVGKGSVFSVRLPLAGQDTRSV